MAAPIFAIDLEVKEPRFTYRVTFDAQYVNALISRYYAQRPFLLRPLGQGVAFAACFAFFGLTASYFTDVGAAPWVAAGVIGGALVALLIPKGLLLRFKRNSAFGKAVVVTVSDSGVDIEREESRSSSMWTLYENAVRHPDGPMLLSRGAINWLSDSGLVGATPSDVFAFVSTKVRMHSVL